MPKKKQQKLQTVSLGRFTPEYVQARRDALVAGAGERNAQMDRYERVYDMDVWQDEPQVGEKRVTSPLGFQTVQQMVALLFTRQYTINVPQVDASAEAVDKAQKKEKYLYAVNDLAKVRVAVRDAAWFGAGLGHAIVRLYYKAKRFAHEFPLCYQAVDPRNCFGEMDPLKTRYTELVHTWQRTRREVEREWGKKLRRPERGFDDKAQEQAWLDGECDYTEYWVEEAAEEEREQALRQAQGEERAKGVMEMVRPPNPLNNPLAEPPEEEAAEEEQPKKKVVLVPKIVHCCVVEDEGEPQMVKAPVIMPGYSRIPFFFWGGVRTPRQGQRGFLSVLYPLTNGAGGSKSLGVYQAINELLAMDMTITERFANPPALTDDDELNPDTTPGAMNQVKPGRKGLWYVENPGTLPDVPRLTQELRNEASRVTIPEVLSGQFVSASGQALGIMSSVFEQWLGFNQEDAGLAIGAMFEQSLELTEYYADPDEGWKFWGDYKRKAFEDYIKPDDIGGDYRVRVKLSANLPRDIVAMLSLYARLVDNNDISQDTWLDLFQKLTDAGQDTPAEEKKKILADMAMKAGPLAQQLAQAALQEFMPLLQLPPIPQAPSPQPSPGVPGQVPGSAGAGGMAGMPVNPEMVAAMGNLGGAQNMPGAMMNPMVR